MAVLSKLWRVYIFDLQSNEMLGEIEDVRDLRISFGLSKHPTLGFVTGFGHYLTDEITGYPGSDPYRGVLAYRWDPAANDYVLRFAGPILATDEAADQSREATVSISSVGAGWRLSKRIAETSTGAGHTEAGINYTAQDRGQIAAGLITTTNTRDGNSWIRAASGDQAASSIITIEKEEPMQPVSQMIDKLSNSLDGFDWVIEPAFTTDSAGIILGRFKSAPNWGSDKRDSVTFDYGIGRFNVESITRKRTIETMLNKASFPASGQTPYLVSDSAPEMIGALGVFEEVVSGDLVDPTLREKLVQLHTAIRRRARVLYEFIPARSDKGGNVPVPFTDYELGDMIGTRGFYGGRLRLESGMRIYGFDIELGNDQVEKVKLDLYMQ